MQVGHGETRFEDEYGEGSLTWVDPLEKRHTVEGHAIVQNLLTVLLRVYAPLKRRKIKIKRENRKSFENYITKNNNSPTGPYKFPMCPFGKDKDWNFKVWTLL